MKQQYWLVVYRGERERDIHIYIYVYVYVCKYVVSICKQYMDYIYGYFMEIYGIKYMDNHQPTAHGLFDGSSSEA